MKNTILLSLLALAVSSCKDDDATSNPQPVNQGEVITTVILMFEDTLNGSVDTFKYRDADGPGGNAAVVDSIIIPGGVFYNLQTVLLDETKSPVDTISNEVAEEAEQHLFVYSPSPATGLVTVSIQDVDANNQPLGLFSTVQAFAGTGSLGVQLRHYNAVSDKTGNTSGYDTDISVSFGVRLQ